MTTQKRRSDWCGRAPLRSPGRPPAARRKNYQLFWAVLPMVGTGPIKTLAAGN
jgi:hypothetical protein